MTQSLRLAVVALIWLVLRRYRTGTILLVLSAPWLGLCAMPEFADWLQRDMQDHDPSGPAASYPTADAIVVVAAAFRRQGREVISAPAIEPTVQAAATRAWLLRRSALRRSRSGRRGYIARWVYELRGWA